MPPPSRSAAKRWRLPAPNPWLTLVVAFVVNLCLLPVIFHPWDILTCWLPWARASDGSFPWDIYRRCATCDYPVFWPYLLTVLERIRLTLHLTPDDMLTIYLLKLPGMFGQLAGIPVVYFGLRRVHPGNGRTARRAALLYALCPALLVNGVLWGQIDTILSLGMIGATLALMNRRTVKAGAWLGFALSVKLQAILIGPALLLYSFRRFGLPRTLAAIAACGAVVAAMASPFLIAGTGGHLYANYASAVGRYPKRTVNAYSAWILVNCVDPVFKTMSEQDANVDFRPRIAGVTPRSLGLGLFGLASIVLLVRLWRDAEPDTLATTTAASVLACFVLCTQMHERYGVPAAALLTLAPTRRPADLWRWILLSVSMGWNQVEVLVSDYAKVLHLPMDFTFATWRPSVVTFATANVLLLISFLWHVRRPDSPTSKPPIEPV